MNKSQEEGIQVLVRIRPVPSDQLDQRRSVILSDCQDNTIVVQTNNKKEFFSFDYIASENCHQEQLFDRLGQPIVEQSLKGYNCCVFSYGQTGAGKTYSILGHPNELVDDPYSDSRGILPRMLEEMFVRLKNPSNGFHSVTVNCSYLQIYNEQIIDLMSKESKNLFIREDLRRGVFVQGLTELSVTNYQQVLNIITKGLTVRKTAATSMNAQSSRSHTIFTMLLNLQFEENDIKKSLKSKIHVVDLAGSERTKLTKVEGERLKEGCNINKSLLTLSNVICSLVQSGKKKKYIPFRDSKLTFFLKDSLNGNSKTKLLANISPKVAYIGDTISTLMFAKRAKIVRTRVEPNENIADNFQSLRTQIRKLRQQLAQTKFIQTLPTRVKSSTPTKRPQISNFYPSKQVFLPTQSFLEVSNITNTQFEETLKVFEDNEYSYRIIVQNCLAKCKDSSKQVTTSGNLKSIFSQKKRLQVTVQHQQKLINNFPAFTKLFNENLKMKKKIKSIQEELDQLVLQNKNKNVQIQSLQNVIILLKADIDNYNLESEQNLKNSIILQAKSRKQFNSPSHSKSDAKKSLMNSPRQKLIPQLNLDKKRTRRNSVTLTNRNGYREIVQRQNSIIDEYESIIQNLQNNFAQSMSSLTQSYKQLQQLYHLEQKQKQQIRKQRRKQPELETLSNQNQYLKLNIMELQSDISNLQEQIFKKSVQIKANKQEKEQMELRLQNMQKLSHENGVKQSQIENLIQKLRIIKQEALKADDQINQELLKDCQQINQLQGKLSKMMKQNYTLLSKNQNLTQQINMLKGRLTQLGSIDQSVIDFKQGMECTTTFDDEDFTFQKTLHDDMVKDLQKLTIQKERLNRKLQQHENQGTQQRSILEKASNKILSLTKDVTFYKQQSAHYAQQARTAQMQLQVVIRDNSKYQDKVKLMEVEISRFRKEIQKNNNVSTYIRSQFQLQPMEFVEEARSLKQRNSLLNQQNMKLRQTLQEIERRNNLLKNSKSLTSLTHQKPSLVGLTPKIIYQKGQKQTNSVPISHRDVDPVFKKKQTHKKLGGLHQQKQKTGLQFKAKPQSYQSVKFFKKPKQK